MRSDPVVVFLLIVELLVLVFLAEGTGLPVEGIGGGDSGTRAACPCGISGWSGRMILRKSVALIVRA